MFIAPSYTRARPIAIALSVVTVGLALAACGTQPSPAGSGEMSGMDHPGMQPTTLTSTMPWMDHQGMGEMASGDGLAANSAGFGFAPAASSLPAGKPNEFQFTITGAGNKPVTSFEPDQTKLMHFYLIRSDLTGFQHVHPTMSPDGKWAAPLAGAAPGTYRAYPSFTAKDAAGKATPLVLSNQITVPGEAVTKPLPPPSSSAQVDGYTLTLNGQPRAGAESALTVSIAKNGQPVTDLQPCLDTYAHLTAFHDRDLAFAHLHPQGTVNGDHGGPTLTFEAMLPKPGNWRLFLQFQTGGALHTASITLPVS